MREMLDQWDYVVAAYVVTIVALVLLAGWSWLAMHRAEGRRDRLRADKGQDR